jgi:DNA-binding SARP family transcriptional activator
LNEALHRLRTSLGSGRLRSHGETIVLDTHGLEVDALRFTTLVASNPAGAVDLLRGDFLEGFAVEDAPGFEDWASAERARFRAAGAGALVAHGERLLARGEFMLARHAAQRAIGLEPYTEPATHLEMRAAALAGDPTSALKIYREFTAKLQQIGEQPSRDLAALAERIRNHRWRPSGGKAAVAEPPLVGRAAATVEVDRVVREGLGNGPRALVITGDPGAGKTRLLNHSLERLALEGAVTIVTRPLDGDQDTSWSTLRGLMRAGLLAAPGLPAADPRALGVLAALVPELAGRVESQQPRDRGDIAAALASLLRAIADETSLALGLDQAQFSDGATLAVLHAAMEQLRDVPVVLLLASPSSPEGLPPELLQLQREIGQGVAGTVVRLEPLGTQELGELVKAMAPWCSAAHEQDRLARRIAFETGGNPFLAVTVLRELQELALLREDALAWPPPGATFDSPLPMEVPDLIRRAIVARLVRLDPATQAVLGAASVGGLTLDLQLISELAELSGADLDERLAVLERQKFLTFQRDRYVFAAPLVQQVVRSEGLTPGQVQRLRSRAVAALAHRQDLDSRVLRAELLARITPGQSALDEAVTVAKAALASESRRIARRALVAAERAVQGAPTSESRELEEIRTKLQN